MTLFVLHGSLQAQPRTCAEIRASIDQKQLQYHQYVVNMEVARDEIACLTAILSALSEAQVIFDTLDDIVRANSIPSVQYPACADVYGPLTVEEATALSVEAMKNEDKAFTDIKEHALKLDEEVGYYDGCN